MRENEKGGGMIIIGIDPGLTGAIAQVGHGGEYVRLADMPTMARSGAKAYVKNQVNAGELAHLLRTWLGDCDKNEIHFFIETPIAFPGQHVSTTAAAFLTSGLIEGVVMARNYAHTLVAPKDWKKALQLSPDKEQGRARAIRLFPGAASMLSRVKDHNRAEALLIAKYGHGLLS